MNPQFSLAHLTVMALPPPAMIYVAARAGYETLAKAFPAFDPRAHLQG